MVVRVLSAEMPAVGEAVVAAEPRCSLEPLDRRPGVPVAQVHHQVDRPATALASVPVEEFGAGDRKRATLGTPLRLVSPVTHRAPRSQDDFQRDRANQRRLAAGSRLGSRHVPHATDAAVTDMVHGVVRLFVDPASQALAVFHVDDVTVGGQPIDQGGRQLGILQKRTPLAEAQVGRDDRRLPSCAACASA